MKNILVINAGSSSLKYQVIDMETEKVIAKGLAERIGLDNSILNHSSDGKEKVTLKIPFKDHGEAMKAVMNALINPEYGVMEDLTSIVAVGHRVLHGGERFNKSMVVTNEVLDGIRDYIELGPLHNPANIKGIETSMELMPGIPNVAVFDTSFHTTMPDYAYLYGIPYEAYKDYKIRKYGFHGTSHKYISLRATEFLKKDPNHFKLITCHLGNGSSLAAVKDGKCVDTTMGLTPLEGVIMGTRSGDIDPAAIPFLMKKYNMSAEETVNYLNKKSGMIGISGVSSDFRDLWEAADNGNEMARLALHMFNYRIKKYIGAFAAVLNGVDAIVFAGGIGENDKQVRKEILDGLTYLGIKLDDAKNDVRGEEVIISAPDSKVLVAIIPTNEELMIARDTYDIVIKGKQ